MSNKLILVILHDARCDPLIDRLLDAGYHVTTFSSIGAFFRRKHITLMIGCAAEKVEAALAIIRAMYQTPPDADEHYATIFVVDAGGIVAF
jgi:uncharacterized protein YaaQ